jgi:hypothetical protein
LAGEIRLIRKYFPHGRAGGRHANAGSNNKFRFAAELDLDGAIPGPTLAALLDI